MCLHVRVKKKKMTSYFLVNCSFKMGHISYLEETKISVLVCAQFLSFWAIISRSVCNIFLWLWLRRLFSHTHIEIYRAFVWERDRQTRLISVRPQGTGLLSDTGCLTLCVCSSVFHVDYSTKLPWSQQLGECKSVLLQWRKRKREISIPTWGLNKETSNKLLNTC